MDDETILEAARAAQRQAGKLYAARRRVKRRACLQCKAKFETVGRGLYCSKRCRWLAAYYRRATRPQTEQP